MIRERESRVKNEFARSRHRDGGRGKGDEMRDGRMEESDSHVVRDLALNT